MTLKEFTKGIELMKRFDSRLDLLNEGFGINIIDSDLISIPQDFFELFLREYFSLEGLEIIYWWIFEDTPKIIYYEENTLFGKEEYETNLDSIESLWNYLNSNKIYLKNGSTNN